MLLFGTALLTTSFLIGETIVMRFGLYKFKVVLQIGVTGIGPPSVKLKVSFRFILVVDIDGFVSNTDVALIG